MREKKGRKYLTKLQIVEACKALQVHADRLGVKWCLIGGALFKMLGIPGYETCDIDVAATDFLDLPSRSKEKERWASFDGAGKYRISGIDVDWMPVGRAGSQRLFKGAVDSSYLSKDGVWLGNLEFALAIKMWAGRPQDKETIDEFTDNGLVNKDYVRKLVDAYCERV